MNQNINLDDYQKSCALTAYKSEIKEKEILTWGLGITGEAGDVASCIKKTEIHGNDKRDGIKENLGDTMWYIAMICNYYGWSLNDVVVENMKKLEQRYNGSFSYEAAQRKGEMIDWNK